MKNKITILLIITVFGCAGVYAMLRERHGNATSGAFPWPLERGAERNKLLTFGLYVAPNSEQNPIDPPERFTGFHTALDFEIFPDELNREVAVFSVCDGMVVYRGQAEGYGGVLVHTCTIRGQEVTVLYGHLDPSSITVPVQGGVKAGDRIGVLGDHKSAETGDTRKHLHLGIHKGRDVVLLGYVQNQHALGDFIDPLPLFQ